MKKIISLGGADDRKSFFYAIKNVDNFVSSAHLLIEKYQLAGFDLDFEINRPYTVEEAKLFADVVAKLRQKLGSKTFITVPTIIDQETLKSMGKDNWKIIANNANFISMMCYDLSSPDYTEFASNLYLVPNAPKPLHNATLSCDQSIKYLIALGVPPAKIVLGIPAFAISSGGVRAVNDGLFQPSDKAQAPTFDDMGKGLLRYSTVRHLNKLGFERHLSMSNGNVDGVWLYNPEQHQFITFDNPQSVHEKVDYVLKNKLGGVMMWRIGQDVSIENKESLLKTIAEGLH